MQSSHGKSRWRQAVDADDELLLPVSRTDDDHVVPYSRSHHHSNRSNTQKTSSSDRYRNPETSLSHRQNGDWRTDDGTHSSNRDRYDDDEYTYTRRDKYVDTHNSHNAQDSRHHDERTNQSSRHSHKDWRNPEDVHTTSPHVENGSWATSSRHGRNGDDLDDYIPTESSHERGKGRYERDPGYSTKDDQSTRRGKERKHDGEDRRSRDGHSDDRLLQSASRERPQVEERSWEPAASWKPRERSVHIQTSDGHSNRSNNKRNSKDLNQSRRNQHTQRRDRRDDSDMNNWQKRDFNSIKKIPTGNTSNSKTSTKRKQAHSPILSRSRSPSHSPSRSRSRSRSPAYSTYSYRSSIRSRSRSFSPKRRKYDKRDRFIPNSSYRESRKGQRYERRSPPSSPLPRRGDDARARPRRPSISSVSSRSRSPSTSPLRSRTKHRLPTATTLRDIDLSAKNVSRLLHTSDRDSHKQKNGRHSAVTDKKASYPSPRDSDLRPATQRAPKSPSFLNEHPHETSVNENHVSPKFNRKGKGFKPIGKPPSSASVRKFFPGDDDESDVSPHQQRNRSPTPPAHSPVYDTRDKITPTDDKSNRVHYSEEAHDKRKSPPISHRAPATVEIPIQPPNHEIHPSEPTQSNLRHRHEEEQIHYEAAPKTIRKMLPGGVYGIVSQVGEGTFGQVYKAQNAVSGVYVALKRIRMETERDGFPVTAMREIKLLQSLRHSNVVHLYEMMVSQGSVYMVFEYMDHDLTGLLSQPQFVFSDAHLKSFCYQMLSGLAYLHHKGVIHRDIKGSNILINNLGELKLGDFGLARFYQKRRRSDYTNRVITLWYRPPELLFGATVYGPEVDMWSAGCIMLELFCKKPVFQGNDEIHQLDVIYKVMGTPTPNEWSGLAELPWYELVKPRDTIRNHFREYFQKWLSPAGLDLAELLLAYDPARRMTAAQALETSYFKQEGPPPEQPAGLSSLGTEWHEYESKRERARKKRKLEGMQGGSELQ